MIYFQLWFIIVCCFVFQLRAEHGQKETVDHGGSSPHQKRIKLKNHYKDGEHNMEFDHESVLGSRKDAEEFDTLSPEESKKRLKVLAKRMDANMDGIIDKQELTAWIENSLKQLDQEEVNERFAEVDENDDGKVTWEEYKKDAFGDDHDELDVEDKSLMEEDKRYFDAADVNKDGFLTKEEFSAFQNPEAYPHMYESLVVNTLRDKDKNKDGFINLEEFLGDTASSDADWAQLEKKRFQSDFDKNKDGKLDKEEMRTWLIPDLYQTAKDEAEHLLNGADVNKDGKLNIEEIVDKYDLFVGSEATNYGEQLEKIGHEEL